VLWYALARYLETKNRYWGLMLGVTVPPHYEGEDTKGAFLTSLKRTVVPLLVGWAVAVLARAGYDTHDESLSLTLQYLATSVYYGAVCLIEQREPKAGLLIGGTEQPTY
jgi:hypothetical protein